MNKKIDWEHVDKLLEAGCTGTEVAANIGVHPDTLYGRCKEEHNTLFSEYSRQKKAKGDTLLRQAQFEEAYVARDRGMLIWLGKQRLGQKDKHDYDVSLSEYNIKFAEERDPEDDCID